MGLDHYAVNVADLQRAADLYRRILGFNVLHKWKPRRLREKTTSKSGCFSARTLNHQVIERGLDIFFETDGKYQNVLVN